MKFCVRPHAREFVHRLSQAYQLSTIADEKGMTLRSHMFGMYPLLFTCEDGVLNRWLDMYHLDSSNTFILHTNGSDRLSDIPIIPVERYTKNNSRDTVLGADSRLCEFIIYIMNKSNLGVHINNENILINLCIMYYLSILCIIYQLILENIVESVFQLNPKMLMISYYDIGIPTLHIIFGEFVCVCKVLCQNLIQQCFLIWFDSYCTHDRTCMISILHDVLFRENSVFLFYLFVWNSRNNYCYQISSKVLKTRISNLYVFIKFYIKNDTKRSKSGLKRSRNDQK